MSDSGERADFMFTSLNTIAEGNLVTELKKYSLPVECNVSLPFTALCHQF